MKKIILKIVLLPEQQKIFTQIRILKENWRAIIMEKKKINNCWAIPKKILTIN